MKSRINNIVPGFVALLGIGAVVWSYLVRDCAWPSGFLLNLGTGLIGSVVVYLLFDMLIGAREKARERVDSLRRDVYGTNKALRDLAIAEMRDGAMLKGMDLKAAHLEGAFLEARSTL